MRRNVGSGALIKAIKVGTACKTVIRSTVNISASKSGSLMIVGGEIHSVAPTRYEIQISSNDHVEGHGKSLIHFVIFADAEQFIFAAQKMADAGVADDDAFGLAGGTGGVNDVGGVIGLYCCSRGSEIFFCQ